MKRYDFRETDVYLGETPEGSFVRYDDAEKLEQENAALKAEIAALKEWRYSDQDLAIKILSYLGFSQEPSKEPYADRRRDRIAEMICLHCESLRQELAAMKAPPKVLSADEVTEPGWYWNKEKRDKHWSVVEVAYAHPKNHTLVVKYTVCDFDCDLDGVFIGPIPAPEV